MYPHSVLIVRLSLVLIQYCESKFLMEFRLAVAYFQYLMELPSLIKFYHQLLEYLDVKYNVFHHLHNELMQYVHYDLDHILLI